MRNISSCPWRGGAPRQAHASVAEEGRVWGEKDGSAGSVWGMFEVRRASEESEEEGLKAAVAGGNGGVLLYLSFLNVFFSRVSILIVRWQCKRVLEIARECTAGILQLCCTEYYAVDCFITTLLQTR